MEDNTDNVNNFFAAENEKRIKDIDNFVLRTSLAADFTGPQEFLEDNIDNVYNFFAAENEKLLNDIDNFVLCTSLAADLTRGNDFWKTTLFNIFAADVAPRALFALFEDGIFPHGPTALRRLRGLSEARSPAVKHS